MAVRRCTWQVQHRHQLRGHHARTCHGSTSRSTATPSGLGLLQEPRVPSPSHQAPLELVCLGGRGAGRVAGLEGAAVPPPRASGHQLSQLPAQQQPHLVLSCWGLLPGPGQPQAPVLGASQGGLWVERPRPAAAVRRGPRQQARPSTALRSLSCSSCGVLCCPLELRRGLKAPRSWAGGSQERTPHCPSGSRCPALRPRGRREASDRGAGSAGPPQVGGVGGALRQTRQTLQGPGLGTDTRGPQPMTGQRPLPHASLKRAL